MTKTLTPEFEARGRSKTLAVLIHGSRKTRESLRHVRQVLADTDADADILMPNLPTSRWSCVPLGKIVGTVLEAIDKHWEVMVAAEEPYDQVILVGHSLGAIIVRKAYVEACGLSTCGPGESVSETPVSRSWAGRVERIVLLAAMNRGWSVNHHLSLKNAILWSVGAVIGRLFPRDFTIFDIRRGSVFLTELRLQWLALRTGNRSNGLGNALTIQLLGSIDDLVSPDDNIDLVSGRDFVYLDVPHSGHVSVVEMDKTDRGEQRAKVFRAALQETSTALEGRQVLKPEGLLPGPDESVKDVVFVLHGIRDQGFWTHKIARKIHERGKALGREVATVTSSYGFFPMLPFLLPWTRRKKVEWFADRYVETVARYPKARLSFVGHSNGTYLLASLLRNYRFCRFERVLFAGSVVPTHFEWTLLKDRGQVQEVANYVATGDWVVAYFPKAFQMLASAELGSAGHDGFRSTDVSQVTYVKGRHSTAIQEDNWDEIASFVLEGGEIEAHESLVSERRGPVVVLLGWVAPLVWLFIALIVVTLFLGIYHVYVSGWWVPWLPILLLAAYILLLRAVLTKL